MTRHLMYDTFPFAIGTLHVQSGENKGLELALEKDSRRG